MADAYDFVHRVFRFSVREVRVLYSPLMTTIWLCQIFVVSLSKQTTKTQRPMYAMINEYEFANEMRDFGFSYDGAVALFDFLEEAYQEGGMGIEFDPVAIQCEWEENSLPNILEQYDNIDTLEELCDHTIVVVVDADKDLYVYNTAF